MLYLHVSNRTENLLRHLVEVLRAGDRGGLFEKELFLIQSQGMERMISQALAVNFGSWCNYEYFLPLGFLHYSAGRLGMEITPDGYERRIMAWRLEELLRELEGGEYRQLRDYLQGENLALKRYQLADRLANIFDQYQMMRPEMLAAWSGNRLVTKESAERWQKALWQRLSAQQAGSLHRGALLRQVIERLRGGEDLSAVLPKRLSVFGLSILPPLFLDYLEGLALHCDVHLYVLSPCREYWGDIEHRRKLFERRESTASTQPQEMVAFPESHPLLVALGQQGRDFQQMLFADEVRFELEFASYEDPLGTGPLTLLRQLQSDLLQGELSRFTEQWPAHDHSIRIISCHSRLREITILKEHVQHWLYQDPELKLRDIIVMAPDIQEYAALIPAVFDSIQHTVSDRSLRRRNGVLAAFADFLALFEGRFGWEELLDLVKEPAIAGKLLLTQSDLENLQQWVTGAGVRWGLSAEQRREMGQPEFPEGSWRAGLDRLLMGYAIDSDEFVDGILPFTGVEGSGAAALGGLCQFIGLVEQAREDFTRQYTLGEWSRLLVHYAGELFESESVTEDSQEFLELNEILIALGDDFGEFHQSPVDFRVIRCWLEHTAGETRSSSGFLRGQLTFCSMLPMRSIPFKVVCLIGLNDGAFPKNDRYATFDLMALQHRAGDRSQRMDDRYQFLEALVAAREILYLSYIGKSIKNNEPIPPSVVVTELLEVLEGAYGAGERVTNHPLHPFSSRYFNGESERLFSYDDNSCQVANRLQQPKNEPQGWWRGQRPELREDITAHDLLSFYSNPQRWFVRDCLGIRLDGDIEVVAESEVFEHDTLEDYLINQELLEGCLRHANAADMLRRLQAEGRWPLGIPGALSYEKKIKELTDFAAIVSGLALGESIADLPIELEVAGYRLTGRLSNLHQGGILLCRYASLAGRDLLCGWLHYLLYERAAGRAADTHILARDGRRLFAAGCGTAPDLETMVEVFLHGCRQPSRLYIEPGIAWVKKAEKGSIGLLDAAQESLIRTLEKGYSLETALLLRGCDLATVLGEEFEELCRTVLQPVWRRAHGG